MISHSRSSSKQLHESNLCFNFIHTLSALSIIEKYHHELDIFHTAKELYILVARGKVALEVFRSRGVLWD